MTARCGGGRPYGRDAGRPAARGRAPRRAETHLELLTAEHRRRGLSEPRRGSPRGANSAASRRRGRRSATRALPGIDALRQDVRFAWRALMRERGTTLAAIALLTIGVSSTVVLADVLDRLLLRPPTHVDDPARVRRIYGRRRTALPASLMTRTTSRSSASPPVAAGHRGDRAVPGTSASARGAAPRPSRLHAIAFTAPTSTSSASRRALGPLPSARRPVQPDGAVSSATRCGSRGSAARSTSSASRCVSGSGSTRSSPSSARLRGHRRRAGRRLGTARQPGHHAGLEDRANYYGPDGASPGCARRGSRHAPRPTPARSSTSCTRHRTDGRQATRRTASCSAICRPRRRRRLTHGAVLLAVRRCRCWSC